MAQLQASHVFSGRRDYKQKIRVVLNPWKRTTDVFALGLGEVMRGSILRAKNLRARKDLRELGPTLSFLDEKTEIWGPHNLPKIAVRMENQIRIPS